MVLGACPQGLTIQRGDSVFNVITVCGKQPEKMETPFGLAPSAARLKCVLWLRA